MNKHVVSGNAVIYLRVSTKEQAQKGGEAEGYSIPAQRIACRHKAESLGAYIADEFVDAGESAKTSDRPQLQAMLNRLSKGDIQYVIIHKVDRLARNRVDDVNINLAITKAGARLVSVSENIDESPSGHLLHGIMSDIAEFYSKNLAVEVLKGMTQKVQSGGTVGLAAIGYVNVPRMINNRRASTVEVDKERAPIIQWAFQMYATGQYSISGLTDMMAAQGLTTLHRRGSHSRSLSRSQVDRMLHNRYYIGKVKWNGVEHEGIHTPLVSKYTFQRVQEVLEGHRISSDRQRSHNHYLRSTLWCGSCGSRLCFSRIVNRHGSTYDYFFCTGRKNGNQCPIKYLEVERIERQVTSKWRYVRIDPKYSKLLRGIILEELQETYLKNQELKKNATKQHARILREQKKLLEAHYANAIPLTLLKDEQERLAEELDDVERDLRENSLIVANVERNLERCLKIVQDCHRTYEKAEQRQRRLLNQAVFKRILVDKGIETHLTEEFGLLLSPNVLQPLKKRKKHAGASVFVHNNSSWSDGVPTWLKKGGWWDKIQVLLSEDGHSNLGDSLIKIGLGWNKEHLVRVMGL